MKLGLATRHARACRQAGRAYVEQGGLMSYGPSVLPPGYATSTCNVLVASSRARSPPTYLLVNPTKLHPRS